MTLSIWRYSHLLLAIASSLFLLIASATGVVLALEPITHQAKGYAVHDWEDVSLATTLRGIAESYDEAFTLEVESSGFVKASVLTDNLENLDIYIDPRTGQELGNVSKRPFIYSFSTNLHRSLFLKSTGRFFVGLISLLLFLIALTGMCLLARRQGGIKRSFSKVRPDYFEMRYHVLLSRWLILPIVIVALTGVYLSAATFELLPGSANQPPEIINSRDTGTYEHVWEIPLLNEIKLDEVRKVDFPFSDDPEEYFLIALQDREIQVNQRSGVMVSSADYPFVLVASRLSLVLHTGEGSVLWSLALLLTSASILFFMYSGFTIALRRRKKTAIETAMPDKDTCEYIILAGSETGTTFDFAKRLYNALTRAGKSVFLTELNSYTTFAKAQQLIILTATYGEGEPPTNARKFRTIFPGIDQPKEIGYSILGFGSRDYPDYCRFAEDVEGLLDAQKGFRAVLPLATINKADFAEMETWARQWSEKVDVPISIDPPVRKIKQRRQVAFTVIDRSALNVDDTFTLRLKPNRKIKFTSGDLLSIFPNGNRTARQFSIARIGVEILLSIKKRESGIVSSYLYGLKKGDTLRAAVDPNPHFHFPKHAASAILIGNGTGIAPFLGMIASNNDTDTWLFWGGRTSQSFEIYEDILESAIAERPNFSLHKSFSREVGGQYVQDLVALHGDRIVKNIEHGGTVMICGSLAMQHDVLDTLETLLKGNSSFNFKMLEANGQLKMDCY